MRLRHKLGMVGLGALTMAGGLALPASPASADTNVHWLTLGGTVRIKDDEVIARRDKYCNRSLEGFDTAQLPWDRDAVIHDTNNKCGGEVRVEFHLTGTVDDAAGWCVTGVVELYEGTSESAHDLDGSMEVSGCADAGGMIEINDRVRNTDEGGDWADYQIDLLASA
jgi:hypothetical protein